MKTYPTIPSEVQSGFHIIAFNKLDGSNIRAEWSKKKGFYKFGTRKRLLGEDEKPLGEAISLARNKYEKDLSDIFRKLRCQNAICFLEFWGKRSAFGRHVVEPHDITLFDVCLYKQGIMFPKEYLKNFGHLDIAQVLYQGPCNSEFVNSVREGTLENMGPEGVVCKAPGTHKKPLMFKIKRNTWYERLREYCQGDEKLFNELV